MVSLAMKCGQVMNAVDHSETRLAIMSHNDGGISRRAPIAAAYDRGVRGARPDLALESSPSRNHVGITPRLRHALG